MPIWTSVAEVISWPTYNEWSEIKLEAFEGQIGHYMMPEKKYQKPIYNWNAYIILREG